VLLNHIHARDDESRVNGWFAVAGMITALAAFGASFLPPLAGPSEFWSGSPAFFLIRVGILTLTLPLAYAWNRRSSPAAWSPLQQMGRTSLFIYWIHVELVYGLISLKLHQALTHGQAWIAFAAFAFLMLGCSVLKDRVVAVGASRFAVRGVAPRGVPLRANTEVTEERR
jgi:peptidoglycan/LPS O-acetylase OafA/YrhL